MTVRTLENRNMQDVESYQAARIEALQRALREALAENQALRALLTERVDPNAHLGAVGGE